MLIMSLHAGHNATVGLLHEGRVIGLLSQEKLDNVKNSAAFPIDAARSLLEECSLDWGDVDAVAIAGNDIFPAYCYDYLFSARGGQLNRVSLLKSAARRMEQGAFGRALPGLFHMARRYRKETLVKQGRAELLEKIAQTPLRGKRIAHIEHHECHAYSAYFGMRRDDTVALIFTADGSGDDICATVSVFRDGKVERIAATPTEASLGGIYSNTTRFLGMKILEHEYKVMGLAPYCKGYQKDAYERIFSPTIDLDPENPLKFKSKVDASHFDSYLVRNAIGERFDNIAGAVQELLEERITRWIRTAIAKTGIHNIYTGGGVFMNVKLNMRIQDMDDVERAHFLPSAGDESNPIGAGYALALECGDDPKPLDSLYLGVSFSRDELAAFIETNDLRSQYTVSEPADIESEIADLLAAREVVARFAGRCEWGARSLGNRAILAHPGHMASFYIVNDLIKARDFWMPFAPSVLDTDAARYLENYRPEKVEAPFMITAYRATPRAQSDLRAAMHQGDHTIRPQVVSVLQNPDYYRLISEFKSRTGIGAVLNTSLNLHGYPLVASPEQALMTLARSGLRNLALGPFLIRKR